MPFNFNLSSQSLKLNKLFVKNPSFEAVAENGIWKRVDIETIKRREGTIWLFSKNGNA